MVAKKTFELLNCSLNLTLFGDKVQDNTHDERLLVFIPGGPSLSSSYFNEFAALSRKNMNINVGILDLPNHNRSIVHPNMNFKRASTLLWTGLSELSNKYNQLSVFAHSLAGCLIFGSTPSSTVIMEHLILSGVPIDFEKKDEYLKVRQNLDLKVTRIDSNSEFQKHFEEVVPLYFSDSRHFHKNLFWQEGCFWQYGHAVGTDRKPVRDGIQSQKWPGQRKFIIDGEFDLILPEKNSEQLRVHFPDIEVYKIPNCGHFPFLERPNDVIYSLRKILGD